MKKKSTLISLLLAIAMIATMITIPVSAAGAVYKEWTFDDNTVPASIGKGSGITLSAADGSLTVTSDGQWRQFNVGSGAESLSDSNGNKGFYVADHPYLKLNMTVNPTGTKSNPYMVGLTFLDEAFAPIGTKFYAADDNGKTFAAGVKDTYVFDMTRAKEFADDSATLIDLATKKVHIIQVGMFRQTAGGTAIIDSIEITSLKSKPESFKKWSFDDNTVPASIGKGGGISFSAANGCLTVTSDTQWRQFNVGSATEPIADSDGNKGFYVTDYPYLTLDMTFNPKTATTNAYMIGLVFLDEAFAPIATKYYATDANGKTFAPGVKDTYVFDMTRAKEFADDSATLTNLSKKKVHIVQVGMFRFASGGGNAVIDSIEITSTLPKQEASIAITAPANGAVLYNGAPKRIEAEVKGVTPEKVEFFVNGELAGTDTTAPYGIDYSFTEERNNEIKAVTTAGGEELQSTVLATTVNPYRMDFNTIIPPTFGRAGAALDGNGSVKYSGTGTTINIGNPTYFLAETGFDATAKKYLKMRVKLEGTPTTDPYTLAVQLFENSSTTPLSTCYFATDENGNRFSSDYGQFVFDLTKGDASVAGKNIGWVQLYPMRSVSGGTIYIDWVEISDDPTVEIEKPTTISITSPSADQLVYSGETKALTASVDGSGVPEKIEFFVNGVSAGVATEAPYTVDYTFTGEQKNEVRAIATFANNKEVANSATITSVVEHRWDFNFLAPNMSFGSSITKSVSNGALKVDVAKKGQAVNFGYPNIKTYSGSEYRYLKLRAKIPTAAPAAESDRKMWIGWYDSAVTMKAAANFTEDMYGTKIQYGSDEYTTYVFDISSLAGYTDSEIGFFGIQPLTSFASGTVYLDWVEISDNPYISENSVSINDAYYIDTPVLSGNTISSFVIPNDLADAEEITFAAAKFGSDSLFKALKTEAVKVEANKVSNVAMDITELEMGDSDTLALMIWDSAASMTPLANKIILAKDGMTATDAKLAGAFMDHMVIQRDMPVNVWGTSASPDGAVLKVSFAGETALATVENGKWSTTLPALEAADYAQKLTVKTLSGEETITDVLVGDVFFVGGQSNAAYALNGTDTWAADRAGAIAGDNIRIIFSINGQKSAGYSATPRETPYDGAVWQIAENLTEEQVGAANYGKTLVNFSAIGYYFADTLRADGVDVPIGLVSIAHSGASLDQLLPASLCADSTDSKKSQSYNGLIAPFENMTVKGMLWYQGESDSATAQLTDTYGERLSALVNHLRYTTGNADMPVFAVQLSSHSASETDATVTTWNVPAFRAMQFDLAASGIIENFYLVPSLDKGVKNGDSDSAHPKYKKAIGERLAKAAENALYDGSNTLAPVPVSVDFADGYCEITFDKALAENWNVAGFELIKDGVAYEATAEAYENTVFISSSDDALCSGIADGVRYAFYNAAAPSVASLSGANGLPVPTFAIDNDDAELEISAKYVPVLSLGAME